MDGYWITFEDGSSGYCQGQCAFDAVLIAEKLTGKKAKVPLEEKWKPNIPRLPYPAAPIIWQFDHPVNGKTPDFCYSPEKCKGCTSCPQNRSCTD